MSARRPFGTRLADSDVRRVVYLSGLVPDVPTEELSDHIASRLEVEETLAQATGRPHGARRSGRAS